MTGSPGSRHLDYASPLLAGLLDELEGILAPLQMAAPDAFRRLSMPTAQAVKLEKLLRAVVVELQDERLRRMHSSIDTQKALAEAVRINDVQRELLRSMTKRLINDR